MSFSSTNFTVHLTVRVIKTSGTNMTNILDTVQRLRF